MAAQIIDLRLARFKRDKAAAVASEVSLIVRALDMDRAFSHKGTPREQVAYQMMLAEAAERIRLAADLASRQIDLIDR